MAQVPFECRYNKLIEKNPREIVLLRGSGCKWRRCRFCDYHLDFCLDEKENFDLNRKVLAQVTGEFGRLEVINSGSFCDLDEGTLALILETCLAKGITTLYFECHWLHRLSEFQILSVPLLCHPKVSAAESKVLPWYSDISLPQASAWYNLKPPRCAARS